MSENWYYADATGQNGPVKLSDLTDMLAKFPSAAEVLVWREGLSDWTKAGHVPELNSFTRGPPPLSDDVIQAQPPVWKVRWWWLIFALLFLGSIGSSDGRRMMAWRSAERRMQRRMQRDSQRA